MWYYDGIVVIDFIDMDDDEHRRQVLRTLERSLDEDPVKTRVIGFNDLGLVVLTRKRSRESLSDLLQEPCPNCHGTGQMKTAETVCYEIFRAVMREYLALDTASALPALRAMAQRESDVAVRALAARTLTQIGNMACPA